MSYPKVLSERVTIEHLLVTGNSVSRYGDGELRLCYGGNCVSQKPVPSLQKRLKEILVSQYTECLVCIPNIDPISKVPEKTRNFHAKYADSKWTNLYRMDKRYGSTFITRPDNAYGLDKNYFDFVRTLWDGRDVVLVNGDEPKAKFDKHPDIMTNARMVDRLLVPARDAWESYDDILKKCLRFPLDSLFILAVGPTATVLAYDLSLKGYQALDLGHFGRFYSGFLPEE